MKYIYGGQMVKELWWGISPDNSVKLHKVYLVRVSIKSTGMGLEESGVKRGENSKRIIKLDGYAGSDWFQVRRINQIKWWKELNLS